MVMLGGRAAEELIFNHLSTGAKDDLKKVTEVAMQMVCEYGMSDLGFVHNEPDMIRSLSDSINQEINKIINECYETTYNYLKKYKNELEKVSAALLEKESLSRTELDKLLENFLIDHRSEDNEKELEAV